MLPFRSFYGFESWLDPSGYNPNIPIPSNSSLINPTNLDGGKSISTADINRKSTEACKSHREAERRRRQRINAHLSTLRTLLPNTPKSDKASLLAEVVQHVKDLRRQADDVARQLNGDLSLTGSDPTWPFPGESDEANVSCDCDGLMKATVCCEDRPNLNRDIARAIRSVQAKAVRAEMMTVGGRTKSVVVIQWLAEEDVKALERALTAVVENRALVGSGLGRIELGRKRSRPCCDSPNEF